MFIKAKIQEKNKMFIASITWSWYGFQHYEEFEIFSTLAEAEKYILKKRCNDYLSYAIEAV